MTQVILVGGPTLGGKSNFVDAVIGNGERFARPRSFTTRPRRPDETRSEYEYISVDEFERLKAEGVFVTVDEVYGNLYSIAYSSIAQIVKSKRIAIKEVHSKNHAKIKGLLPDVLSVLLLPRDSDRFWSEAERNAENLPQERLKRIKEVREFYESVKPSSYPFDIVIWTDSFSTTDSLKAEFISAFNKFKSDTKGIREVERRNRAGYDFIASEFTDEKRITTANFHDLSLSFFETEIARCADPSGYLLDLGAGRGHLAGALSKTPSKVVALDLSIQMLRLHESPPNKAANVCASAFGLPLASGSLKTVASSLADPFLIGECLNEICRVLATNGVFIFSSPSRVWSLLCEDWSFFIVMLNPTHHGFSLPMPLNTTLRRMG